MSLTVAYNHHIPYRHKLGCDSVVARRVMRWICVLAVAAILEINTITVLGKLDRTM